ncbi:MAG: hypothetical protein ACK4N5_24300, partial [Myxococcales bacterium]
MKPLFLLAALAVSACGTEQQRRTFPVELVAHAPAGPNEHGWTVTLDEARANVGPIRFFAGKAPLAKLEPLALLVGTAWAHPGHYGPGDTLGELLVTAEVDLLAAAPVELGVADAITGHYGSVRVELPVLTNGASALKGGESLMVRGTAIAADGTTVRFRASHALSGALEGIP